MKYFPVPILPGLQYSFLEAGRTAIKSEMVGFSDGFPLLLSDGEKKLFCLKNEWFKGRHQQMSASLLLDGCFMSYAKLFKQIIVLLGITSFLSHSTPNEYFQKIHRLRGIPVSQFGMESSAETSQRSPTAKPISKSSARTVLSKSAAPINANWEIPFFAQGPNGGVHSLGFLGDTLIVSGQFHGADDIHASTIAQWNGMQWSSLGGGLDNAYQDYAANDPWGMVVDGNRIYMAAAPENGGVKCNGPAYWEGAQWICMEWKPSWEYGGFGAWKGNAVLAAPESTYQWNGSAWKVMPEVKGSILRLKSGADGLWMSGKFSIASDSSISNLAKWDGRAWSGFGHPSDSIRDFTVAGSRIFAIENHTRRGQPDSQAVVRWDGTQWLRADAGITWSAAMCLASDSQNVYLAAASDRDDIHGAIWQWNGTAFTRLAGSDYIGTPYTLSIERGKLYLGGLLRVGSAGADNVAEWDGKKWNNFSNIRSPGPFHVPEMLRSHGTDLYVGGSLVFCAGNKPANGLARWNGSEWDPLGGGFSLASTMSGFPDVEDMAFHDLDVYAGGRFDSAQGAAMGNIARWDGKSWHALGQGFPARVRSVVFAGDVLVAGGDTAAKAVPASPLDGQCVGQWDGSSWKKMGEGLRGRVDNLAYYRGGICALGNLRGTGDSASAPLRYLNAGIWQPANDPGHVLLNIDSVIDAVTFRDTLFFIGFAHKSYQSALYHWDGNRVGKKGDLTGDALATDGINLYMSAFFPNDPNYDRGHVFRYAGGDWIPLLSESEFGYINSMAVLGDFLYIGGRTRYELTGRPPYGLARWNRLNGLGLPRAGIVKPRPRTARLEFLGQGRTPGYLSNGKEAVEIFGMDGRKERAASFRSAASKSGENPVPASAMRLIRSTKTD